MSDQSAIDKIEKRFNEKLEKYLALGKKRESLSPTDFNPNLMKIDYELQTVGKELETISRFMGYAAATNLFDLYDGKH